MASAPDRPTRTPLRWHLTTGADRGRRPPEHSVWAFDDRIELESPGHGAARTATFSCPLVCRNCYVPNGAVQAREAVIVTARAI